MSEQAGPLLKLLEEWAVPPPELVGKLPRAGIQLDYLGHAEVTRALIECDPAWTWEPFAVTDEGLPAVSVKGSTASMWIRLTVHGVTRVGVGTAPADKSDVLKELVSDALRNAAMRFGVALSLWSKQEWEEHPEPAELVYTLPQAKGAVLEAFKRQWEGNESEAKAEATKAWAKHGPKGDGPFTPAELAPVFAVAGVR